MSQQIKWLDSFKLAWFYFARSRGWSASVTLSSGVHMEGADKTFAFQSPLYKFSDEYEMDGVRPKDDKS